MTATTAAAAQPVEASMMGAPETSSLLAVAEMAPEVAARASPTPSAQLSASTPWQESAPKASPGAAAANTMDAVKQRVAQILSSLPKPDQAKGPETTAPKTGASFPPAGN
jgi:hypothetical protein